MKRGRRPRWMIKIGEERIDILLNLADNEFSNHPERSHHYVKLARNISMKYNIPLDDKWKRRVCKNCYKFLKYGVNSKVRLHRGIVNISCLDCGHVMKIPYTNEKKIKRRKKIESYNSKKRDYE